MTSATVEQAFFKCVLKEIERNKIDALSLLELQTQCREIKSFQEFCNSLAIENWDDSVLAEMLQWQKVLGLSNEQFYRIMNLPLTRLTTALQTQNLSRILDAAETVNAVLPSDSSD